MLRILADENIPGLEQSLAGLGDLRRCAGGDITADELRAIDVLLVRSVTRVDAQLLRHSSLRFVGSCTTGIDHVDTDALRRAGIAFAHAPGANARSVVEYVFSALCWLALNRQLNLPACSVGIVGLGQIGGRLYRMLSAAGLRCMAYDPFVSAGGDVRQVSSLEQVLQADVVTLHTPLTRAGAHPTWHMLDAQRLRQLRPDTVLINSCRGAVVDNAALCAQLGQGERLHVVLDVWEGEPLINRDLLLRVALGTPHIAGYSYDGKVAGVAMVLRQLFAALNMAAPVALEQSTTKSMASGVPLPGEAIDAFSRLASSAPVDSEWRALCAQMLAIYDVERDDRKLREAVLDAADPGTAFTTLRRDYPVRREASYYRSADGAWPRIDELQRQA